LPWLVHGKSACEPMVFMNVTIHSSISGADPSPDRPLEEQPSDEPKPVLQVNPYYSSRFFYFPQLPLGTGMIFRVFPAPGGYFLTDPVCLTVNGSNH
jgi:hypothetical protein